MKPDNVYDEALFHLERLITEFGNTPLREGEFLRLSHLTEFGIIRGALERAREEEDANHRRSG